MNLMQIPRCEIENASNKGTHPLKKGDIGLRLTCRSDQLLMRFQWQQAWGLIQMDLAMMAAETEWYFDS